MAVDLWSENSSPRISFSHDLSLSDIVPVEPRSHRSHSSGLSSSFDFDFCPTDLEPLTADEFFSDGKILPIEIKRKLILESDQDQVSIPSLPRRGKPEKLSTNHSNATTNNETEEKRGSISGPGSNSGSKSFWKFKRSSSLNCGSGYARSLCPLPLLSRSNSTGSTPSVKNSVFPKESSHSSGSNTNTKHSLKTANSGSSPSKPAQPSSSFHGNYQKPPLMRKASGVTSHGNGVRVNPHVLNVPTGNLFGLGTVFFSGKEKNKRK